MNEIDMNGQDITEDKGIRDPFCQLICKVEWNYSNSVGNLQ